MDVGAVAGASQLMKTAETQQAMSTSMIKKAAEAQTQVADMLAQNAKKAPQAPRNENGNFSTYA